MARLYASSMWYLDISGYNSGDYLEKQFALVSNVSGSNVWASPLEALVLDVHTTTYDIYYSAYDVATNTWTPTAPSMANAISGLQSTLKSFGETATLTEVINVDDFNEALTAIGHTPPV